MPKDAYFNRSYGARTSQPSESIISDKKKVIVLLNDLSFQFNKLFNNINKPTLEFRVKKLTLKKIKDC
ncbi:hypothetical protein BpHYR1_053735 [Brachionus plicatilis]|uniref:Uncharacterized protein n=1 Tax=Brachionus plicatilis TaxID=10195 RepID=A0A3M7PSS9_BRAPC|nr:hypothetical protein BpHYR1_053735 [Brachionus plicatilis]